MSMSADKGVTGNGGTFFHPSHELAHSNRLWRRRFFILIAVVAGVPFGTLALAVAKADHAHIEGIALQEVEISPSISAQGTFADH